MSFIMSPISGDHSLPILTEGILFDHNVMAEGLWKVFGAVVIPSVAALNAGAVAVELTAWPLYHGY